MMTTKRKVGMVNRGPLQPPKAGKAAQVLSADFKPGTDDAPVTRRSKAAVNVSGYSPKLRGAASAIDRALRKKS